MNLNSFFFPGMWVMRKMRFATKLSLLTLVLLLPMLMVLVQLFSAQSRDLAITRAELEGIALVSASTELIRQLQTHRGQTNMVLSGNTAAQTDRDATRVALRQAREALDARFASSLASFDLKSWTDQRTKVDALVSALEGKSPQASFALHTALIDDLTRFTYGLANESSLLFEPDPATYLLMDMVVSRTLPWNELLGKLRGQGAGLLSQPVMDEAGVVRLQTQLEAADQFLKDVQYARAMMRDFGVVDPAGDSALVSTAAFITLARERFVSGAATGAPQAFFTQGTQSMAAVSAYQRSAIASITQRLEARLVSLTRAIWLTALGSLLGVLAMLYFMLAFHRSFMADLRQVLMFMEQTADGNLRHRVRLADDALAVGVGQQLGFVQRAPLLDDVDERLLVAVAVVLILDLVVARRAAAQTHDLVHRRHTLRADLDALEAVGAVVDAARVICEVGQAVLRGRVARVADEAVGLGRGGRSDELGVGLHRKTVRDTHAAVDAGHRLGDVNHRLVRHDVLALRRIASRHEPRHDAVDLLPVDCVHVDDQVLDHRHVAHRLDVDRHAVVGGCDCVAKQGVAGQRRVAVDAHTAGSADRRLAAAADADRAVLCGTGLEDRVEHGAVALHLDLELLPVRRFSRFG